MRARLVLVLAVSLLLGACELPTFGAPDSASEQGDRALRLWQGTFVAAMVVGLIVVGLIAFVLVRYRHRGDEIPSQHAHNLKLELVYTAVPVAIVAVLFAFTVVAQERVTATTDDPDVRVEVSASSGSGGSATSTRTSPSPAYLGSRLPSWCCRSVASPQLDLIAVRRRALVLGARLPRRSAT